MMNRKILAIILIGLALMLTGCPFLGSKHTRGHMRVWKRDFTEIYRFVDRHAWNYEWDDPSAY